MTGQTLGRAELEGLLVDLGTEAERRGVHIDLFLVGGGAITLAYNDQRTTGDLDAVFEPTSVVRDIAETVARHRTDLSLSPDWLNDAVKGFLPGNDPHATILYDTPHCTVSVASPRYLFILKAIAARESDEDDLRLLWPLCDFADPPDALDAIDHAYPRQPIKATVQYLVEAIAAEFAPTTPTTPPGDTPDRR